MANTYNWKINALDAKVSVGDNKDVVYTVHWSLIAASENKKHTVSNIGTYSVEYDADNFVAYKDLTEEIVIGWLKDGLNVESMKAKLDAQIEKLITPQEITYTDPFAPGAE
jgi:hypothetical protein